MMTKDVANADHASTLWKPGGRGHYTNREDMYFEFLDRLLPEFKGGSVLEVGPGSGVFAEWMFRKFDVSSYTVLDLASNINDSRDLLESHRRKCEYVLSRDYESLFGRQFDLFVSNVCIPETPVDYREDLCGNVLPNCRFAFIIGASGTGEDDVYGPWIRGLFAETFNTVREEPTQYCGTFAIAGMK